MRTLSISFFCMMLMAGCATTYTVGSKESGANYDSDESNRRIERREGTVVFNSGKVETAKQIIASKDSVSWLEVRTDKKSGASMGQLSRIVVKDHLLGGLEGLGLGLAGGGGLGMIVGSVLIKEGNTGSGSGAAIGLILGGIAGLVVGFPTGLIIGHSDVYEYPPPEQSDSLQNINSTQNNEQGSHELSLSNKPEKPFRVQPTKMSVNVFLHNGGTTSGYLSDLDRQSMTVVTVEGDVHILNPEIQKIIIPGKHAIGKRVAYGALIGSYLNVYLNEVYKKDPYYLVNQSMGGSVGKTITSILSGMLAGATVGFVIDGLSGADEVIDFDGGKAVRTKGLERLRSLAEKSSEESPGDSRMRLTVQGGQVFTHIVDYGPRIYGVPERESTNFNWMRRCEISYSATDEIEVGVSEIWFGEPILDFPNDPFNQDSRYYASGYYLMGHYSPFLGDKLDNTMRVSLGAGVGRADVSFQRKSATRNPNGMLTIGPQLVGFSETLMTGIVLGEARFRIADGLTLAITVDHVIAPTRDAPGDPTVGIEPKTFNLGNTSLGFSLGLRF